MVVSTGTASGKSLCYQLAVLEAFAREPQARALFLFPTKALAQDQARKLNNFRVPGVIPAIYDGDTPQDQRPLLRRTATILLTNPDMLHIGILPGHERWAEFLHQLRYVVLDEAHVYRGVFGSHVAQVVRRLRRLCAQYGADPRFVLTSATIGNPEAFAERLVGTPFEVVDEDQAPRPERTVVLWNPPLEDPVSGVRRSALAEASYITAESVLAGARVIAFAPTRKAAELIYGHVRRRLEDRGRRGEAGRVQPYRAGYTPEQRRDIERRLFDHELDAVIATQALELGIDVGSLDVALVTGFPGTVTSLRQRWGRAGRSGHGYAVLVAGQDALDQYFMREPDRLLGRGVEEAIIDLHNPHISGPHLEAAAYERPLTPADETYFGEAGMLQAERLVQGGRLRRRKDGLVWTHPYSPAARIGLRTASNEQFAIVEGRQGEVIGTVERERVFRFCHPGAVYLHLGKSYLVQHLDLETRTVMVDDFDGSYYTQTKTDKNVLIAGQADTRELPGAALFAGDLEVTEQVIAYQRRDMTDGHIIDTTTLDLPEQTFTTQAFWLAVPQPVLDAALTGLSETDDLAAPGAHPRRRARAHRPPAALRDVRPLGHRRPQHAVALADRHGEHLRLRRVPRRHRPVAPGLRRLRGPGSRSAHAGRRVPVRERLPELRAEPQVRQPQRAAQQARRGAPARPAARLRSGRPFRIHQSAGARAGRADTDPRRVPKGLGHPYLANRFRRGNGEAPAREVDDDHHHRGGGGVTARAGSAGCHNAYPRPRRPERRGRRRSTPPSCCGSPCAAWTPCSAPRARTGSAWSPHR